MLEIGCTCAMRASASRYTCITLVLLLSALCCAEAFPKALVIKVQAICDLFSCMIRLDERTHRCGSLRLAADPDVLRD